MLKFPSFPFFASQSNTKHLAIPEKMQIDQPIWEPSDQIQSAVKEVLSQWCCLEHRCKDEQYESQLKNLHMHSKFQKKVTLYEECWENMSNLMDLLELYMYKDKMAKEIQIEIKMKKTTIEEIKEAPTMMSHHIIQNPSKRSVFSPFISFWKGSSKNERPHESIELKQDFSLEPSELTWETETLCAEPIPSTIDRFKQCQLENFGENFDRMLHTETVLIEAKWLLSEISPQLKNLNHVPVHKKPLFLSLVVDWGIHSFITVGGMFASLSLALGIVTSIQLFASVTAILVAYQALCKVYKEFYMLYLRYSERPWEDIQETVCKMQVLYSSLEKIIEEMETSQNDYKQALRHQESNARIDHHFGKTQQFLNRAMLNMRSLATRLFDRSAPAELPRVAPLTLPTPDVFESKKDLQMMC